jgi:hypothetical protein
MQHDVSSCGVFWLTNQSAINFDHGVLTCTNGLLDGHGRAAMSDQLAAARGAASEKELAPSRHLGAGGEVSVRSATSPAGELAHELGLVVGALCATESAPPT